MKSKLFTFVLIALALCAVVSAASFTLSPDTISFNSNSNSLTFTVTNTNTASLLNLAVPSSVSINGENGYSVIFNIVGDALSINALNPRSFTVSPQSSIDFSNFNFEKTYSTSVVLYNSFNPSDNRTLTLNIVKNSFCENGNRGNLDIEVSFDNDASLGGEDDIWYPTENIKAEITVDSSSSEKVYDVVVNWGVYNKRTGDFLIDEEEDSFDLKARDDNTVTVSFSIDPKDINADDDESDYIFFVKAYSDDSGQSVECKYITESIKIPQSEDFVVLSDINIPETVQCGETLTASFKAWNLGDNDQDDVSVVVTNKNIPDIKNGKIVSIGDIDSFDSVKESMDIEVPKNLTEGSYVLEFRVLDEDNNVFENDDEKSAIFTQTFKVQGACEIPKSVQLSAVLSSEAAVVAKEVIVKATVKNTGQGDTTYLIQVPVSSYESWATLKSISDSTITLKAGESKDITITLVPNRNSQGDKEFTIQAIYGSLQTDYTVKLTIEPPKSIFSGLTGLASFSFGGFGGNWFIWVVAALNIVLVVLIVVIAIRIARK